MATTWKDEQSIARFEILHAAGAVAANARTQGDTVVECFARGVAEYMQAELDAEAQEQVRTLPPFDPALDHDGDTQPGVANPAIENGYIKQCDVKFAHLTCQRFHGHEGVHRAMGTEWANATTYQRGAYVDE